MFGRSRPSENKLSYIISGVQDCIHDILPLFNIDQLCEYNFDISVVTVSHLARSVDFGSVLRKKPRFRYGSVFILLRSNSLWLRRRPRR